MNETISYLLSPIAIRERTQKIFDLTVNNKTNFIYHPDKLESVCDFVIEVIKDNYPDLNIPFHSRWGHFKVGNIDRVEKYLDEKIKDVDPIEKARIKLDLVITSVLLDAGAGPDWKYKEGENFFNRSEGLGVASFHMFLDGAFSKDGSPKADAQKLKSITAADVEKSFQVSNANPLVGAQGRAGLLKSLGECVASKPEVFEGGRPGNIIDHMIHQYGKNFKAVDLLQAVLLHFGDIWPSRINLEGTNLGDVWEYSKIEKLTDTDNLVPFHKLSQWLTYSLIEPIEEAGVKVENVFEMTGLAEYRNGGLLIDSGLITLKDEALKNEAHRPNSELIIEWRALTVNLLDKIADIVREKLGKDQNEFPLAKVLEGGTWWAGRRLAKESRPDSTPPLKLASDGTVF
jgi:hypothetical protein